MPGVLSQPPADLHAARAGHIRRHRVQPGVADEPAAGGHFERPQPVALVREAFLDQVDERVAGRRVERAGKELERLRIAVQLGERLAVGLDPAPHQQPVRPDRVESR